MLDENQEWVSVCDCGWQSHPFDGPERAALSGRDHADDTHRGGGAQLAVPYTFVAWLAANCDCIDGVGDG